MNQVVEMMSDRAVTNPFPNVTRVRPFNNPFINLIEVQEPIVITEIIHNQEANPARARRVPMLRQNAGSREMPSDAFAFRTTMEQNAERIPRQTLHTMDQERMPDNQVMGIPVPEVRDRNRREASERTPMSLSGFSYNALIEDNIKEDYKSSILGTILGSMRFKELYISGNYPSMDIIAEKTDRIRQRIERACQKNNYSNTNIYIAKELDKLISQFFPLYTVNSNRLNGVVELLHHLLFGGLMIHSKVRSSKQSLKQLALESVISMIKFDTETSLMTTGMCNTFLKKRLLDYCQRVFTSELTAKLIYSFIDHYLLFDLENIKVSQLALEMNPEGEILHNYVKLVYSRGLHFCRTLETSRQWKGI